MKFYVIDRSHNVEIRKYSEPTIYLRYDNWNDYSFVTQFQVEMYLPDGPKIYLGDVKIIRKDQTTREDTFHYLPKSFKRLDRRFCSLGQSIDFYKKLRDRGRELSIVYLEAMRDVAWDKAIRDEFEDEVAFGTSLVRSSLAVEALHTATKLFGGESEPAVENFVFTTRLSGASDDHVLSFDFTPRHGLPHRMAVLVGLNGVGKTTLMARLAVLISGFEEEASRESRTDDGVGLAQLGSLSPRPSFYGTIAISFSAFDDFELPSVSESKGFRFVYCGLRTGTGRTLGESEIGLRAAGLVAGMDEAGRVLLNRYMAQLCPGFPWSEKVRLDDVYAQLGAGQRIALNIICDLLVHVSERTLVLLDEPETHLHPQLLATLIAVVSEILEEKNAFAIVATHSPIVVQQVMSRSVQVIRRLDDLPMVDEPRIECFGAGLGDIIRAVFDTTEADRGYEEVIDRLLVSNSGSVSAVESLFGNRLGLSASVYLRSRGAQ